MTKYVITGAISIAAVIGYVVLAILFVASFRK